MGPPSQGATCDACQLVLGSAEGLPAPASLGELLAAAQDTPLLLKLGVANRAGILPSLRNLVSGTRVDQNCTGAGPEVNLHASMQKKSQLGGLVAQTGLPLVAESSPQGGFITLPSASKDSSDASSQHVLAKMAAILSPALAQVYGKEQTTKIPESIKGTYLDPSAPQNEPTPTQVAGPMSASQAFLPRGGHAPSIGQGLKTPPRGRSFQVCHFENRRKTMIF